MNKEIHNAVQFKEAVKDVIDQANNRLKEITAKGFPFAFNEVKLSWELDSEGVYVDSGTTPVFVAERRDIMAVFKNLKATVWKVVDATRTAVERRSSVKEDVEALKAEESDVSKRAEVRAKAEAALKAAGVDTSVLEPAADADAVAAAAVAVNKAVHKAVREANKNPFVGAVSMSEWRMSVKTYANGVIINAGGKPCLVTRYPKVVNNHTVERMVMFLINSIRAIHASRMAYYMKVNEVSIAKMDLQAKAARSAISDSGSEMIMAAAM